MAASLNPWQQATPSSSHHRTYRHYVACDLDIGDSLCSVPFQDQVDQDDGADEEVAVGEVGVACCGWGTCKMVAVVDNFLPEVVGNSLQVDVEVEVDMVCHDVAEAGSDG